MEAWLVAVIIAAGVVVGLSCFACLCCWRRQDGAADDDKAGEMSSGDRGYSWSLQPARTLSWLLSHVGGPPAPKPTLPVAKERVMQKQASIKWLKGTQSRSASQLQLSAASCSASTAGSDDALPRSVSLTAQDRTRSGPVRGVRDKEDSRLAQHRWLSRLEEAMASMRSSMRRSSRRSRDEASGRNTSQREESETGSKPNQVATSAAVDAPSQSTESSAV